MTRQLRLEYPGAVYHLLSRGDRRNAIYRDDVDRSIFLDLLAKEVVQQRWRIHAYCLMGNHYHLLIETPDANLVAGMRRLNGVYTQVFNKRHGLVGHVLQGRYKSIIVERDVYLLELARYIVLNPVRANLVQRVEDWPWSSYRMTAGIVAAPSWLSPDDVLSRFGHDRRRACGLYKEFVHEGVGAPSPWQQLRGQVFLGTERFLQEMEATASVMSAEGIPRAQRFPSRPGAEAVLDAVAQSFGIDQLAIESRHHQAAFQTWVYLMRRVANLNLTAAARRAGVSPGRVSQIQSAMESEERPAQLDGLLARYKV